MPESLLPAPAELQYGADADAFLEDEGRADHDAGVDGDAFLELHAVSVTQ